MGADFEGRDGVGKEGIERKKMREAFDCDGPVERLRGEGLIKLAWVLEAVLATISVLKSLMSRWARVP